MTVLHTLAWAEFPVEPLYWLAEGAPAILRLAISNKYDIALLICLQYSSVCKIYWSHWLNRGLKRWYNIPNRKFKAIAGATWTYFWSRPDQWLSWCLLVSWYMTKGKKKNILVHLFILYSSESWNNLVVKFCLASKGDSGLKITTELDSQWSACIFTAC